MTGTHQPDENFARGANILLSHLFRSTNSPLWAIALRSKKEHPIKTRPMGLPFFRVCENANTKFVGPCLELARFVLVAAATPVAIGEL